MDIDRIKKLFVDWYSAQPTRQKNQMKKLLEKATRMSTAFPSILEAMGQDGSTMKELMTESTPQIKKEIATMFLEAKDGTISNEMGTYYYPINDGSNALVTQINPNDRDIIIQIRHAITGGNYTIAEELIKNSWSKLRLNDRLSLIEWVDNMGYYNRDSEVPKTTGHMRLLNLKRDVKNKTVTKDEFAEKVLRTAKDQMKIS